MLLPQDRELIEFLKSQGVEFGESDLRALNEFHFYLKTNTEARLADCEIEVIDPQGGKIGFTVAGFLLGGALSFAIGVPFLTAALIGSSIGSKLGSIFNKPEQAPEEKVNKQRESRQTVGFGSAPQLVTLGGPIPLIYTNKSINPNGGIRLSGSVINTRIDTEDGVQKLFALYGLCLGPIGEIDTTELQIDGQNRSNFYKSEIVDKYRYGFPDQPQVEDFPSYSQSIAVNTNALLGMDLRSEVNKVRTRREASNIKIDYLQNCYDINPTSRTDIVKNGGNVNSPAMAVSSEVLKSGEIGFVSATVLRNNVRQVVGICTIRNPGNGTNNIPFYFSCRPDASYSVVEFGVTKYSGTYARNTQFAIEYSGRQVRYRVNGKVVYTSTYRPGYPARLVVQIYDESNVDQDGARINQLYYSKNTAYAKTGTAPGIGTTFSVDDEDFDKFSPSDTYWLNGKEFKIVEKNYKNNTITTDIPIALKESDPIYATWKASFETSKAVEQIDINLVCRLYAYNYNNKMIRHGVVFDVYLKGSVLKGRDFGWQFLARFYVGNNTDAEFRRSFKIKNLPKGNYQIELRPQPLIKKDANKPLRKLVDTSDLESFDTPLKFGSQPVTIETQLDNVADADIPDINYRIGFDGVLDRDGDIEDYSDDDKKKKKRSVSSSQGAPIRIVTINEIVLGKSNYANIALAALIFRASDRINSSPSPSFLITEGRIDRNHIAAGTATVNGTVTLGDVSADFLNDDVEKGMILRNLDKRIEAPIVEVSDNAIRTSTSLAWEKGDRYLVYFEGSSCYFPDIYASILSNPLGGLGAILDADEFIDYPSIVKSRKFCAKYRYFWDGVIASKIAFSQWATQESVGSLLFPFIVDGRYALIPEQKTNPVMVFNASNTFDYKEEWVDWAQQQVNTLIVSYTDGSDDYKTKTVTIQTGEAWHGDEERYEESLALPAVTNRDQAVRAGGIALKSRKVQNRSISFKTGLQGCYLSPGELIVVQHILTEWNFERSGFVTAIGPFNAEFQGVLLSIPLEESIITPDYRAAVLFRDTGRVATGLRAEIDLSYGYSVRIYGLDRQLNIGDTVVLGEEIEERRTYRVSSVQPSDDGSIGISAVYWNEEILDLKGLVIDGVCYGAEDFNPIDRDEIKSWIDGLYDWVMRYRRDNRPLIVNSDYLVAETFHENISRGNRLPSTAGSSIGQFAMIRGAVEAYLATGSTKYRDLAVNLGNAAIFYYYSATSIPASGNYWAPHEALVVKGPTNIKSPVPFEPLFGGLFNVLVSFANGIGYIGGTNGQRLANVYRVYSVDDGQIWSNVYAPTIAGSDSNKQISYWVSDFELKGTGYRRYPNTESFSGTIASPTAEPLGKIVLTNTNISGSFYVTFSVYDTTQIGRGTKFPTYPFWRLYQPTEEYCRTESFGYAEDAYRKLLLATKNEKWRQAQTANRYSAIVASNIVNEKGFFLTANSTNVFYTVGTAPGLNYYQGWSGVTIARNFAAGNKQYWAKFQFTTSSATVKFARISNQALRTKLNYNTQFYVEVATNVGAQLELELTIDDEIFSFNDSYRAAVLTDSAETPVKYAFKLVDFIQWRPDRDIVWHPRISDGPFTLANVGNSTVTATAEQINLGEFTPVVVRFNFNSTGGGASSVTLDISNGYPIYAPPSFYLKISGDVTIRLTDGAGKFFSMGLNGTGDWQRFSPTWNDFQYSAANGDDPVPPNTTLRIQNIVFVSNADDNPCTLWLYWIGKDATTDLDRLTLEVPNLTYKASIIDRYPSPHTLWVGDFKALDNDANTLPYPGVLPVYAVKDASTGIAAPPNPNLWLGAPSVGNQSPTLWARIADRTRLKNVLQFLEDSQNAYYAQSNNLTSGPFAPAFLWNLWNTAEYTKALDNTNPWGWESDDPHSNSALYQYRALSSVAEVWYLDPNNARAEKVTMRFLEFLKDYFDNQNSGQPPTRFDPLVDPINTFHSPECSALILVAAVYANLAGGDAEVTRGVIDWSVKYLRSQRATTDSTGMLGNFTNGQSTFVYGPFTYRESYGFAVGELLYALSVLYANAKSLKNGC